MRSAVRDEEGKCVPPSPLARVFSGISCVLKWVPFREVLISVLILWFVKEQYPFSHFPMYASLSPGAWVVYVTTPEDEVVPFRQNFILSAPQTSKVLRSKHRTIRRAHSGEWNDTLEVQARQQAGMEVLEFLLETAPGERQEALKKTGLRLYEVRLEQKDGEISHQERLLAEIPPSQP